MTKKPVLQRTLKILLHIEEERYNWVAQERVILGRKTDKHMRIKKESNVTNSVYTFQ
jgi:hypothetical protein